MSDQPTNDGEPMAQLYPPYQLGLEDVQFSNGKRGVQLNFLTPYGPHVYHMTGEQAEGVGKRLMEMGQAAKINLEVVKGVRK